MTEIQHRFCIRITQKLMSLPIAASFLEPVDPNEALGYLDKIKKPMDLGSVFQKLMDNQYGSVDRWKEDVNLIWRNAMTYNAERSILYALAKELNEHFRRKCEHIPRNELEVWIYHVNRTHTKLMRLLDAKPDPTKKAILTPSGVPKSTRPAKILLRQKSQSVIE
jgi:hypothetical protein